MESRNESVLVQTPASRLGLSRRIKGLTRFMRTNHLGATGLVLVVFFGILAVAATVVSPYDPLDINSRVILVAPGGSYWFGTDDLGRDILSRTIHGARVSIYVGLMSMAGATLIGSVLGVSSAYFGGWVDLTVQRFIDGLTAFPSLLLALALMAALGTSFNNVILALIIVFMPRVTRVTRSVSLSIRETPYVDAAVAIGASNIRIMLRHVLPNTFAPLMVIATSLVGSAILIEANLSFLGVGMPADIISWGAMLSGHALLNFASAPWIGIFPGMALTLLVFGVNVFGDGLRDALDPKLRGR